DATLFRSSPLHLLRTRMGDGPRSDGNVCTVYGHAGIGVGDHARLALPAVGAIILPVLHLCRVDRQNVLPQSLLLCQPDGTAPLLCACPPRLFSRRLEEAITSGREGTGLEYLNYKASVGNRLYLRRHCQA